MRPVPAIIDGQRNVVTGFFQDHHEKEWFIKASAYLQERRGFVQRRFIECMRYVEVHSENCDAFSYELAGILRDCGSVFSSVLDAMIKGSEFTDKEQTSIADYKAFLKAQDDSLYLYSVHFRGRFPGGLILPLYSLKSGESPGWWNAYNCVKHSEYDEYRSGNLGNAASALASLVILEVVFGKPSTDEIWTNIGSRYEEDSFDMNTMKRLFPKSELTPGPAKGEL
jgi:hypothetical protein